MLVYIFHKLCVPFGDPDGVHYKGAQLYLWKHVKHNTLLNAQVYFQQYIFIFP